MQEQNFKNHGRLVPLYHGVTFFLWLAVFIGSIVSLVHASHEAGNLYNASLIVVLTLVVGLIYYFTRAFALKAQDRAIRAEERLRYFMMTGKAMSANLRMGQVIALRFASDEEFVALCEKAEKENLGNKAIKMAIKNWKGDFERA